MLGKLVPCGGGPPILLLKPKLLVGRQKECDIPLRFPTVSSRHCELELREGYWFVRDLQSKNGTRVNGKVCTSQWLLPNDVLTVATPRYAVTYTPLADRPPPGPIRNPKPHDSDFGFRVTESPPHSSVSALGELIPCGGGDPIPLRQPRLLVGRHPNCDIILHFANVSGHHCHLVWTDGYWYVRDLGSRHGIRVNGVPCQAECLKPGSVLGIAGHRFQVAYAPPGADAPPEAKPKQLFVQSLLEAAGLVRWKPPEPAPDNDNKGQPYVLDDPDS
jgi:adenylate cyclase